MKTLNKKRLERLSEKLWAQERTTYRGTTRSGFLDREEDSCRMCGKALTTETHRRLGIGPECINQNRLKIGILTNRWMDFMTGAEIGESRPIQGDPLMDFETHEEAISDEVDSEMRDFLAELEQENDLDGFIIRPAEIWEEPPTDDPGDIIPRWRCWTLFRNPAPPYEWRDALSEGKVEADWRRRHMLDGLWQSHDFVELDTFATISMASMDKKSARIALEPPLDWWIHMHLEDMKEEYANNFGLYEDNMEGFTYEFGVEKTPYEYQDFAFALYAHLIAACGCDPSYRVCDWCAGAKHFADSNIRDITKLEMGINRYGSEELVRKPDYDELGRFLQSWYEDREEDFYGWNPANPHNLRGDSIAKFVFATSALEWGD